jgi:hypothetical protein
VPTQFTVRCIYCHQRAGFLRRVCGPCSRVIAIVERAGGSVGLSGLVDLFAAEGLSKEQVERVLDAEIGGGPTIRDRLTSNMTNALMQGLGMPGRQSPEDVRRIRSAAAAGEGEGTWTGDGKRPGSAD